MKYYITEFNVSDGSSKYIECHDILEEDEKDILGSTIQYLIETLTPGTEIVIGCGEPGDEHFPPEE